MRMNMRVNYNHNQPETADFPVLHCFILFCYPREREGRQEREKRTKKMQTF